MFKRLIISSRIFFKWPKLSNAQIAIFFRGKFINFGGGFGYNEKLYKTKCVFLNSFTTRLATDLNSGFGKVRSLREFFSGVNIGVLRSFEGLFELVELEGGEGGAGAPLLPTGERLGIGFRVLAIVFVAGVFAVAVGELRRAVLGVSANTAGASCQCEKLSLHIQQNSVGI